MRYVEVDVEVRGHEVRGCRLRVVRAMSKSMSVRGSLRARTTDEGLGLCSLNRKVEVRFSSVCLIQRMIYIRWATVRYEVSGSHRTQCSGALWLRNCPACSLVDILLGGLRSVEVDRTVGRRSRTPGASLR